MTYVARGQLVSRDLFRHFFIFARNRAEVSGKVNDRVRRRERDELEKCLEPLPHI